ncbi:MAG: response regulator [Endomicrobia bacterium]|nr:response regulator [Endomicrobiia bacterium]
MKKVLVIEDDLELQDLIKFTFQHMGYDIYQAYDGKEGLKKVKEVQPDIVILDVIMPEMNGFEVLEELRKDPQTCLLPVIMLTSLSHAKDRITGVKLGADEYLVKPVEPYEIVARVEALLKKYYDNVDEITLLPGLLHLENHIKQLLSNNTEFKVVYLDMCNFKAYNIKYGFSEGDKVLKLFSGILRTVVNNTGSKQDTLYHIEADKFVIITYTDKIEEMVENIFRLFEDLSSKIYDQEALENGYFVYSLQEGVELKSNLMKLAVAVVNVVKDKYTHYAEVLTLAKEMLNVAKEKCMQSNTNQLFKN